jgi:uncharacterized 2Fe-2S/4Fe-4S cluster protein (DUF4445 family)
LKTVQIRLHPLGKILQVRRGSSLKDALHEFGVEFSCGRCAVRILDGKIETDPRHGQRLKELGLDPEWRLACLSSCGGDLTVEVGQFETIIQADETPFEFEPGSGSGVAVDLGTTTLVAQLVDLESGHILAVETGINPQKVYGSDLISRLEAAISGGPGALTELIRLRIGSMVEALSRGRTTELAKVVIVGNTVMQHLFCGSDIRPLSFYPFESPDLDMKQFTSRELGWSTACDRIRFYPSIGSFVGSDILAGIEATGMYRKKECSVLIDLGTNGEIVAGNRERLLCASTAAGPAFEGARISKGMLATTGAISSVYSSREVHPPGSGLSGPGLQKSGNAGVSEKGFSVSVIGNAEPRGICGSGLIDAVGLMLEEGLLGEFGEILSGEEQIRIAGPVSLTQKDIHEFQLAKSAIATGLEILLGKLGIDRAEVSDIYLAGAFGTYINLKNILRTGMLDFPEGRIHKLGNTAVMGARMFLFSKPSVTEEILGITDHINLESEEYFQDLFISHMNFAPGNHDS